MTEKAADALEGIASACPQDFPQAVEMYLAARDALLAMAAQQQEFGFGQTRNICSHHTHYNSCPHGKDCNKHHRCAFCKYRYGVVDCHLTGLTTAKDKKALNDQVQRPKANNSFTNSCRGGFNKRRSRSKGRTQSISVRTQVTLVIPTRITERKAEENKRIQKMIAFLCLRYVN